MSAETPIMFISGWAATNSAWDSVRRELPDIDTYTLDWAEVLRDGAAIEGVLASRPGPWLLVGWSLGALLALRTALKSSERLRGLILISGTACMCAKDAYPGANPRALHAMRARLARNPRKVLADFAEACAAPDGGDAIHEQYLNQARQFSTADLALGLGALATLDLRAQTPALQVSTLLIHGASDALIPVDSARALIDLAPNARLEILEDHGHALPLTAPHELAHFIRSFAA